MKQLKPCSSRTVYMVVDNKGTAYAFCPIEIGYRPTKVNFIAPTI
jgi:hypothetical protein